VDFLFQLNDVNSSYKEKDFALLLKSFNSIASSTTKEQFGQMSSRSSGSTIVLVQWNIFDVKLSCSAHQGDIDTMHFVMHAAPFLHPQLSENAVEIALNHQHFSFINAFRRLGLPRMSFIIML